MEPEIKYWDSAFGVMVEVPMVRGGGVPAAAAGRREVRGAWTRAVMSLDVWSERMVVEVPVPRVMGGPFGERVWLDMTYWDCAFGVIVSLLLMMIGAGALVGGVKVLRGEVVMVWEPAASVVVRMMAGRWVVEVWRTPWASVEVRMVGRDAETEAVKRLVEVATTP